jgi:hypothetical protein
MYTRGMFLDAFGYENEEDGWFALSLSQQSQLTVSGLATGIEHTVRFFTTFDEGGFYDLWVEDEDYDPVKIEYSDNGYTLPADSPTVRAEYTHAETGPTNAATVAGPIIGGDGVAEWCVEPDIDGHAARGFISSQFGEDPRAAVEWEFEYE